MEKKTKIVDISSLKNGTKFALKSNDQETQCEIMVINDKKYVAMDGRQRGFVEIKKKERIPIRIIK